MTTYTTDAGSTVSFDGYYNYEYWDEYMYPGYTFERPVYLYLWEILVIVMSFQNILILSVFLHRTMRNPTNTILSTIAISDSLTGLVTLPTYIMVFQRYDPLTSFVYEDNFVDQSQRILNEQIGNTSCNLYNNSSSFNQSTDTIEYSDTYFSVTQSPTNLSTMGYSVMVNGSKKWSSTDYLKPTLPPTDGYTLSKNLCRGFMISKYFLSKSFHTISIFLTIFLEIQRYISVAYPYKYKTCPNKLRIVKIYCISAFVLCPFLHAYHLGSEKAVDGLCQWELTGNGCGGDCIYLWIAFVVRHFIPCVTLLMFTLLFTHKLMKGGASFRRLDGNSIQYSRRVNENRRISLVVTTVVVVRLIPEIPYSILLLYNSIDETVNTGRSIDLETNRLFHMCYEICLVLSFLANLYIYLIVNRPFRKRLYRTVIEPVWRRIGDAVSYIRLRLHRVLGGL